MDRWGQDDSSKKADTTNGVEPSLDETTTSTVADGGGAQSGDEVRDRRCPRAGGVPPYSAHKVLRFRRLAKAVAVESSYIST